MDDKTKMDIFIFLFSLQDSGVVNMYAAPQFVERIYNMSKHESRMIVMEWMENYKELCKKLSANNHTR